MKSIQSSTMLVQEKQKRTRLLIVTQSVDAHDPVLGFFVRWIAEFAAHAESVEVICLKEGSHDLSENVRVHSLGKEHGAASSVTYALRFLKLAWQLRHKYDVVFVHMNPEYLVLAGWLWRLSGKRTVLWYTHKSVDLKLRIGTCLANAVCTASKESFRLKSSKVHVVGHGIDVTQFSAAPREARRENDPLRILTIGRFSKTKRIREMLEALDVLSARGVPFSFTIAGVPATRADEQYEKDIKALLNAKPYTPQVTLLGAVSHATIPDLLASHDVFINLSATGSMDKAVLEALAAGLPAVTTNVAFQDLLSPAGLFVAEDTPEVLADALVRAAMVDVHAVTDAVRSRFALPHTIETIMGILRGA